VKGGDISRAWKILERISKSEPKILLVIMNASSIISHEEFSEPSVQGKRSELYSL
jgi:hypothetical protein